MQDGVWHLTTVPDPLCQIRKREGRNSWGGLKLIRVASLKPNCKSQAWTEFKNRTQIRRNRWGRGSSGVTQESREVLANMGSQRAGSGRHGWDAGIWGELILWKEQGWGRLCFSKQPPNSLQWDGGILTKLSPAREGGARNPNSQ